MPLAGFRGFIRLIEALCQDGALEQAGEVVADAETDRPVGRRLSLFGLCGRPFFLEQRCRFLEPIMVNQGLGTTGLVSEVVVVSVVWINRIHADQKRYYGAW